MFLYSQKYKQLALLTFILLSANCGRKQHTIFNFATTQSSKISKLELPAARGLQATRQKDAIHLTWHPVILDPKNQAVLLIGYNVYRLTKRHLVPKKPLNKIPTQTTFYIDTKRKLNTYYYLVRGVFKINQQHVLGPVSHIVCTAQERRKK